MDKLDFSAMQLHFPSEQDGHEWDAGDILQAITEGVVPVCFDLVDDEFEIVQTFIYGRISRFVVEDGEPSAKMTVRFDEQTMPTGLKGGTHMLTVTWRGHCEIPRSMIIEA